MRAAKFAQIYRPNVIKPGKLVVPLWLKFADEKPNKNALLNLRIRFTVVYRRP